MDEPKASLDLHDLGSYWTNPDAAVKTPSWKKIAVNKASDAYRSANLATKPSACLYIKVKDWGRNPEDYSFSTGEVNKLPY